MHLVPLMALTAKQLFPADDLRPTSAHRFVRELEKLGKLLRMYSQNIDTLESKAEIERVVLCHGSFKTATCTNAECRAKVPGSLVRGFILNNVRIIPSQVLFLSTPRCAMVQFPHLRLASHFGSSFLISLSKY